jgi:hypothetical protein
LGAGADVAVHALPLTNFRTKLGREGHVLPAVQGWNFDQAQSAQLAHHNTTMSWKGINPPAALHKAPIAVC